MTSSSKRLCVGSIGRLILGATMLVFLHASVAAARPSITAVGSTDGDSITFTISHTPAGAHRLLTVCIAVEGLPEASVIGATFNTSESLTKLTHITHPDDNCRAEVWYLVNPTATTANVVVTLDGSKKAAVGAVTFAGVDQSAPIDGTTTNTGGNSTATVNVSSQARDLVADCMATVADPNSAPNVGSGQTQHWNRQEGGSIRGAGSTEDGTSSVTMSWGLPESKEWATIGFNLNATRRVMVVE